MNQRVSESFLISCDVGSSGYSTFDSMPTTFLVASGVEDAEFNEMVSRYRDF
jgi:hypothetical protein